MSEWTHEHYRCIPAATGATSEGPMLDRSASKATGCLRTLINIREIDGLANQGWEEIDMHVFSAYAPVMDASEESERKRRRF